MDQHNAFDSHDPIVVRLDYHFGFLAKQNILWLGAFNLCIFLQYITDVLDGAVGRERNEGFFKWGYYMDHFLDYIFLCSVIIGYSFLLPASFGIYVFFCLMICGGVMVHFFLDFAITHQFKISYNRFGPTESRSFLILFNFILIFVGKELLIAIFPFAVGIFAVTLFQMVYQSQKLYGAMDMEKLKSGNTGA